MTVKELHARLGDLLATHSDWEVGLVESDGLTLRRVTGAFERNKVTEHGWTDHVGLGSEDWDGSPA